MMKMIFMLVLLVAPFIVGATYVIDTRNPGYYNGSAVCTVANGLCTTFNTSADGTGGWINISNVTSTSLNVNLTAGNLYLNGRTLFLNSSAITGGRVADVPVVGSVMYGYLDKFTFFNQEGSVIMFAAAPNTIYGGAASAGDFVISSTTAATLGNIFVSADNVVIGTDKTLPAWYDFQVGNPENGNQLRAKTVSAIYDTYATTTSQTLLRLNRRGANGVVYPASVDFNVYQHTNDFHPNSQLDINLKAVDSWNESADSTLLSLKSTGDATINANLTLAGQLLVDNIEEDLRFPSNVIKTIGSSNIPDFNTFKDGTDVYLFDASTIEQAYVTAQLPHAWKEGTTIYPHFHWTPTTTGGGNVTWCVEYTWASIGGTFGSTTTKCSDDLADGTAYKHQMTTENDLSISGAGQTYSSIINMRIYRGATSGNDTYASDAALLEFDIHYEVGRLGTYNTI